MDRSPVVSFQRIGKSFPGVRALSNVSLSLNPGEIHAVIGENGAENRRYRIFSRAFGAKRGHAYAGWQAAAVARCWRRGARGIAVVFQELLLVPQSRSARM